MLKITNLEKKYGRRCAVSDLNMEVAPGRLMLLLGPNGSGKTTLMKMIVGLVKPSAGEIFFGGVPVSHKIHAQIAYMPTEGYFYRYMTARDAGKYYRDFFEDFSYDAYVDALAREKLDPKQKISAMSSGMTAKLKLVLTFCRDSRLVMLDEPLNGIDIIAREHTIKRIAEHRKTDRALIVSSHLVDELETMADDAVFMKDGKIVLAGDARALYEKTGKTLVELYREIYAESGDNANA